MYMYIDMDSQFNPLHVITEVYIHILAPVVLVRAV